MLRIGASLAIDRSCVHACLSSAVHPGLGGDRGPEWCVGSDPKRRGGRAARMPRPGPVSTFGRDRREAPGATAVSAGNGRKALPEPIAQPPISARHPLARLFNASV